MSDLTVKEQRAVRLALRVLRIKVGAWEPVARALKVEDDTISKIAAGKRDVTERLAIRVARYLEVSIDELLAGRAVVGRMCHHCGRPLDDFEGEDTRAE